MSDVPFFEAVKKGDLRAVEAMTVQDPGLVGAQTAEGVSAVLLAVYYRQPAVADLLISRGASLNIFEAAATGHIGQVRSWLDSDPALANAYAPDGFQPLGLSAFFGHKPVVDLLLVHGAQVNSVSQNTQRVPPLNSAVAAGHYEIARTLVAHGADVNARQAGDFTPLHGAALNGQPDMVQMLLENGADIHARSADGKTALDFARQSGQAAVVDLLQLEA